MSSCVECGAPIPEKRLAALPKATRCVSCQEQRDKDHQAEPSWFPAGNWALLTEMTEAPILRLAEPERRAAERAERQLYRQVEALEEIEQ